MRSIIHIFLFLFIIMAMMNCRRPYQEKIFINIGPSETAFVMPLEGANKENQKQFKSIDYLNEKKVAAKRIYIPTKFHQTGRRSHHGKWISTVMVIKVDRSPVTREWTSDASTGTEKSNQALRVESAESIEWFQGVTMSASIAEADAATFLYYYAGKPLPKIIDLNVRSFIQDYLTKEFAQHRLDKARTMKKQIFNQCYKVTKAKFAEKGITIENIGAAGGMNYIDQAIQTSINDKFAAEMKKQAAKDQRLAAQEFAKAAESQKKKIRLDIELINAQANKIRAEKWNGALPANIMPAGMSAAYLMGNSP